jgi:prepilin-type N-terminal cleavage/methylation domain-containing protein
MSGSFNIRKQINRPIMSGNRGLTLVEMLVALLIFGIGVISIIQVLPLALNSAQQAENETVAQLLMQRKIEEVKMGLQKIPGDGFDLDGDSAIDVIPALPDAAYFPEVPIGFDDRPDFSWQLKVEYVDSGTGVPVPGIKRVTVMIGWGGDRQDNDNDWINDSANDLNGNGVPDPGEPYVDEEIPNELDDDNDGEIDEDVHKYNLNLETILPL